MTAITIENQQVLVALAHLQRQTENLQPVFEAVGQQLRSLIIDCFEQEKSPDGINWAALDPKTIRQRRNGSNKILQDRTRLLRSIAAPGAVIAINSFAEVTTDVEYAVFHQFGTSKMVARPFFPSEILPQNWETEILDIINNHLQN